MDKGDSPFCPHFLKGFEMDGIILINKEKNCTSNNVVNKVKHILNEKTGHIGTLDPNATGLLPILVGKGTKLSQYLINHDKEYEVELKLGIKTDTADLEGKIIEEKEVADNLLEKEKVLDVLNGFIGKQKQVPPMYSAIKVNGKKLYEYARKNVQIELEAREIEIYEIKLGTINQKENRITFTVHCSKGTYIRSLCEDIAQRLGTIGYMKELNRTKVGIFNIENSISVEELEQNKNNPEELNKYIIPIERIFINIYGNNNCISLNDRKLGLFSNGVKLTYGLSEGLYRIYNSKGVFIGIGSVKDKTLKREIVL